MTKDSRAFIDKSRPSQGFLQNLFFSAADDPAGKLRSLKKALQAAILVNSVFLVIIIALIYAPNQKIRGGKPKGQGGC